MKSLKTRITVLEERLTITELRLDTSMNRPNAKAQLEHEAEIAKVVAQPIPDSPTRPISIQSLNLNKMKDTLDRLN